MSKASKIVILCEDKSHETFMRRFLKTWGVKGRLIVVPPYPCGKGSGKGYVENRIHTEAKAMRQRHASTILLVVWDADEEPVAKVKEVLNGKIEPSRGDYERIAYIVPKWHIETWIAYLDNKDVDESDKDAYRHQYYNVSKTKDVNPMIDKLAGHCRERKALVSAPGSLIAACEEFERVRDAL